MTRFKPIFLAAVSALLAAVTVDAARPHYGGTLRIETTDAAVMRRVKALSYQNRVAVDCPGALRPVLALSGPGFSSGPPFKFRGGPGAAPATSGEHTPSPPPLRPFA